MPILASKWRYRLIVLSKVLIVTKLQVVVT
jgi:hypothetical protein